jgi:hypothetical protein
VINYKHEGMLVVVSTRHATLAGYKKAVGNFASGPAVTEAKGYSSARFEEHEFMEGSTRHVRLTGRELLGTLIQHPSAAAPFIEAYPEGGRLGIFPIMPAAIGGRLELMSKQFEQHKCLRMRVVYEPVVPTTTKGGIIIYFTNDVGTPCFALGEFELSHAATHANFIMTPIWQAASLDIRPQDVLLRYMDATSGDFRLQSQGFITVETAAPVALDSIILPELGNVFIEYEYDFFSEVLSYDVQYKSSGMMTFDVSVTTNALAPNYLVEWTDGPAQAAYPTWSVIGLPTGVGSNLELSDWVFVGRVVGFTLASVINTSLAMEWETENDNSGHLFSSGQAFFLRFTEGATAPFVGATLCTVFSDFASVGLAIPDGGSGANPEVAGALRWSVGGNPGGTGKMHMHGYWIPLTN